jgi:hypothetical protein
MNRFLTHFRNFHMLAALALIIVFINVVADSRAPTDPSALKAGAWKAWQNGDIDRAAEIAAKLVETKSSAAAGQHILFLKAFVTGKYEEALRIYKKIDPAYSEYAELDKTVIHAFRHLGRYSEAEKFAHSRGKERHVLEFLKMLKEYPLKVTLDKLTVIPFAKGQLHEFFPDFEVLLNGKKVIAHVDTGGTFLHMAPARAEKLGIELIPGGKGFHGSRRVDIYHGIAKTFRIGDALLENVPVGALASLVGQEDFIIFGTNLLQQFLSTLDYPNKRLMLSPRNNPQLRKQHLAMLPTDQVNIPFFMGGDHYMFVRGGVGKRRDLNFFIDSGLVSLHPGKEGIRQAAFTAPPNLFIKWGFKPEEVEKKVFDSHLPLILGSLEQEGHLVLAGREEKDSWGKFEEVRIDGLLSHAFLKHYVWTIDFNERMYIFSAQAQE